MEWLKFRKRKKIIKTFLFYRIEQSLCCESLQKKNFCPSLGIKKSDGVLSIVVRSYICVATDENRPRGAGATKDRGGLQWLSSWLLRRRIRGRRRREFQRRYASPVRQAV